MGFGIRVLLVFLSFCSVFLFDGGVHFRLFVYVRKYPSVCIIDLVFIFISVFVFYNE